MFTKGTEVLSVVRLDHRRNKFYRIRGWVMEVRNGMVRIGLRRDTRRSLRVLPIGFVKPIIRRGWSTTKKDWAAGHVGMAKR